MKGRPHFNLTPAADSKPATWCLLLDYYSKGQGYKPFTTTDLANGKFTANTEISFPFRFRHGSVLPISDGELAKVKAAYGK